MKEGWEYKKLGEVCTVLNGFAFKSGKYTDSGTRIMRITNVQKGFIVDDDPKYYPSKEMQGLNQYILKENDLLMSLTGNVGRVGLLQKELLPAALNQRVACLRIKDYSLSLRFLFHWLNSAVFEQDAIFSASGIAQKNLSTEWLKSYKIAIPPLSEQQHIVEELDLLSSIIEKKKTQLRELDNLAQSLFYEMFGDPITNDKGWSYKKLNTLIDENVITYHLDGNHGGDYPRSEEFVDEGVPYIGANSLNNGFVNFSMAKYLPKERAVKLKKGLAINGDVLFAHNATVGPVAYLITNEPLVILSTSLTAYRCNQDKMNPLFLRAYMQSIWFESQYKASMKQTTRNQIPITQQKKFDFILPPISLQNQFTEKIKVIEHQKELINQSIKEVETLFNSRMDYYFN